MGPSLHRASIIEHPDVSVIVVNYNTAHLLDRMFAALDASRGDLTLQVIVVDNASRDNSVEMLHVQHPEAELIANTTNVGFARANNQAIARARGRYVLLLNTDAFVSTDTLPKTVEFMETHPKCGVLGVKLLGEDGSLQPSCRYFPTPWNVFLGLDWPAAFFSANPVGGRHELGPRFCAPMRLGAGMLLSGAAPGSRGASACLTHATSSTAKRWIIAARSARRGGT